MPLEFIRQISGLSLFLFVLLMIWTIIWKGLALWRSAKQGRKIWFIIFLIVNTLGILEILYLFIFSRNKKEELI